MLVVSQLAHLAAAEWHQINLSRAFVGDFVHVGDRERNQITLWRHLWIADPANLQQIVDGKPALLRHHERCERKQTDCDGKETLHKNNLSWVSVNLFGKARVLCHFWIGMATSPSPFGRG